MMKPNTVIGELAELLDAIGGMIIQYQETGIEASTLGLRWPQHRALLLDVLFRQLAVASECDRAGGWDANRIDEDCVSAQEHAIEVLLKAGLVEEVRHPRLFLSRDKREPGYYLKWNVYDRMMVEAGLA